MAQGKATSKRTADVSAPYSLHTHTFNILSKVCNCVQQDKSSRVASKKPFLQPEQCPTNN